LIRLTPSLLKILKADISKKVEFPFRALKSPTGCVSQICD
jgi:hypothetical protein